MRQTIEDLRKSAEHLSKAINLTDEESAKELLKAHTMISQVRGRMEREDNYRGILGVQKGQQ